MPVEPHYPGTYVEEVPHGTRLIEGVATAVTGFVGGAADGPIDEPTRIASWGEFVRCFGGLSPAGPMGYAVEQFFANGGREAVIVRTGGAEVDGGAIAAGLAALAAVPFNLLVVPPLDVDGDGRRRDIDAATRAAALRTARERGAIYLADAPLGWDVAAAAAAALPALGLEASADCALYFPGIRAADPLRGGRVGEFAASGAVAGVIARNDAARGVWRAPAGIEATLAGVIEPAVPVTDAEQANINARGINVLRAFPGIGPVIWGARTLQGDDALGSVWKYLSVRRLALFLEQSLAAGMQWAVFEPNGEPLWAELRLSIGTFLNGLFRQGAFAGAAPRDAYFVRCDASTTTPEDIAAGIVNVSVGFAPLKPAEFVVLSLQQRTSMAA